VTGNKKIHPKKRFVNIEFCFRDQLLRLAKHSWFDGKNGPGVGCASGVEAKVKVKVKAKVKVEGGGQ
jgi:hypothetical protein